jgi:hypothetical protein
MPIVDGRKPEFGGADAEFSEKSLDVAQEIARRSGHGSDHHGKLPMRQWDWPGFGRQPARRAGRQYDGACEAWPFTLKGGV